MISIAILSLSSPKTLENTLSYCQQAGILNEENELIISLCDPTTEEEMIASNYDARILYSKASFSIAERLSELVLAASKDFFLFIEEDWLLVESKQITESIITQSINALQNGFDCVQLRSRYRPGFPIFFRLEDLTESNCFLSLYLTKEPTKLYPSAIKECKSYPGFYYTTSRNSRYYNWPAMYKTNWLKSEFIHHISDIIENSIQDWWSSKGFKIIAGDGLFMHFRVDSFDNRNIIQTKYHKRFFAGEPLKISSNERRNFQFCNEKKHCDYINYDCIDLSVMNW